MTRFLLAALALALLLAFTFHLYPWLGTGFAWIAMGFCGAVLLAIFGLCTLVMIGSCRTRHEPEEPVDPRDWGI